MTFSSKVSFLKIQGYDLKNNNVCSLCFWNQTSSVFVCLVGFSGERKNIHPFIHCLNHYSLTRVPGVLEPIPLVNEQRVEKPWTTRQSCPNSQPRCKLTSPIHVYVFRLWEDRGRILDHLARTLGPPGQELNPGPTCGEETKC